MMRRVASTPSILSAITDGTSTVGSSVPSSLMTERGQQLLPHASAHPPTGSPTSSPGSGGGLPHHKVNADSLPALFAWMASAGSGDSPNVKGLDAAEAEALQHFTQLENQLNGIQRARANLRDRVQQLCGEHGIQGIPAGLLPPVLQPTPPSTRTSEPFTRTSPPGDALLMAHSTGLESDDDSPHELFLTVSAPEVVEDADEPQTAVVQSAAATPSSPSSNSSLAFALLEAIGRFIAESAEPNNTVGSPPEDYAMNSFSQPITPATTTTSSSASPPSATSESPTKNFKQSIEPEVSIVETTPDDESRRRYVSELRSTVAAASPAWVDGASPNRDPRTFFTEPDGRLDGSLELARASTELPGITSGVPSSTGRSVPWTTEEEDVTPLARCQTTGPPSSAQQGGKSHRDRLTLPPQTYGGEERASSLPLPPPAPQEDVLHMHGLTPDAGGGPVTPGRSIQRLPSRRRLSSPRPTRPLTPSRGAIALAASFEDVHRTASATSLASIQSHSHVETGTVHIRHDPDDGTKLINGYRVLREIGRGAQGKVKLVERTTDGNTYALKILPRRGAMRRLNLGGDSPQTGPHKTEVGIMKLLRHKHCVRMYEVIDDPAKQKVYVVMQFCEGGPLYRLESDGTCKSKFTSDEVAVALLQCSRGLRYLRRHGVLHCDIKPDNILRTSDGTVVLSDFGLSERFDPHTSETQDLEVSSRNESETSTLSPTSSRRPGVARREFTHGNGTPAFLAPEHCGGTPSADDLTGDVWALGVTMFAMLFGYLPFRGPLPEIFKKICNDPLPFPQQREQEGVPRETIEFFNALLHKDPSRRLTLEQLREHPWIRSRVPRDQLPSPGSIADSSSSTHSSLNSNDGRFLFGDQFDSPSRPINRGRVLEFEPAEESQHSAQKPIIEG